MRTGDRVINFLLISAGFAGALFVYNTLFQGGLSASETLITSVTSILAFWAAIEVRNSLGYEAPNWWISLIELGCVGTGANLVLHAVLAYAFYMRRTPFLITAGGVFSAALLTWRARATTERDRSRKRILLVGFDSIAQRIFQLFREPLIGVIAGQPALVPAGIPWLGDVNEIENIVKKHQPTNIVVSLKDWASGISPAVLLKCCLSGVVVEESPAAYERFLNRVCCERLQPVDLLLSSTLRGDSRTMAIQSVYTNLIGLALLLALSPVMLMAAFAVGLFSGPGPVFEGFECAGFQYIPFRVLRFRTTRLDATGTTTGAGRLITRLHLTNLPLLLNVVRGDMALVGPRPVRSEFARYLTEVMPFYAHRFSVRPGILGWAQMHVPKGVQMADECRQIEYDLYYIKAASLWLDAEIMLESIGPNGARERAAGL
jgi:lipopolysaccharide/colanic/teichoic acid biosynthesis glycosyltransferase